MVLPPAVGLGAGERGFPLRGAARTPVSCRMGPSETNGFDGARITAADLRMVERTAGVGRAVEIPCRSIFSTMPRARPRTKYSWKGIAGRPRSLTKVRTLSSDIGRMRDLTANALAIS